MNKSKKDYFDICIKILECRNLSTQIKDISTQVCVQVGDEKRHSKVIHQITKPFFDEYFVFTKFMSLSELMEMFITISALHVQTGLPVKRLIGSITMDIATVWNQPERRLKKWFSLSLPSDRSAQRRGFLECDLRITAPSEFQELIQFSSFETSEIIGSKRARYKVLIYRCSRLQVPASWPVDTASVRVWYAGKCERTSLARLDKTVEWNETISFIALYPPMHQRLTLGLCLGKKVIAKKSFNIIDFYKIFPGGFFNMFGPTYVNLYSEDNMFFGSLFMGLESEILGQLREFEHATGVNLTTMNPINTDKYGIIKKFLCFGIIFELVIMKTDYVADDFNLSLDMGGKTVQSPQLNVKPITSGNLCSVVDKNKLCISLSSKWPDCTYRLYNSNIFHSMIRELRNTIDDSSTMASKGCGEEARESLLSACQAFKVKYKGVLRLFDRGITELDSKRSEFLKKQIDLLATLLTMENVSLEQATELYKYFLNYHKDCCEEVQDSLPLLRLTLRQQQTTFGSCVIEPSDIIHSDIKEKRGVNSGKIMHLLFKGKSGEVVAIMDIWLWLGKREEADKCKVLFPTGYTPVEVKKDRFPLPTYLTYSSTYTYTAICHVHSGFIDQGEVSEGECDSFVKVSIFNHSRQTIISKKSLAPTWKETLIFLTIPFYLPPRYLVENPPPLTVQLWNESSNPPSVIGYGLVSSNVRLQQASSITEFPLKWWSLGSGCEVLMYCEMFPVTVGNTSEELFSRHRSSSLIPRQLEPLTIPWRLEVIFWGMRPSFARALKQLVQPQVSIQFSTGSLSSGVIARANTTFNFTRDTRIISLNLPTNRLLSPPLLIKVMSNFKYFTSIAEKNLSLYEYQLPTKKQWNSLSGRGTLDGTSTARESILPQVTFPDLIPLTDVTNNGRSSLNNILQIPTRLKSIMSDFSIFSKFFQESIDGDDESSSDEELEQDWWDRYWNDQMQIYNNALEDQKEFSGFTDVLSTFPIKKKNYNESHSLEIGKMKAIIRLYQWPVKDPVVTTQGQDPEMGILKHHNFETRVNILVRVYCVKASDLYPSDLNGKSDPYIEISTQSKTVSDKENKILSDLNPVFGNYHEITATLPTDTLLAVRVMDWDAFTKDDVIGETIIDIENRFYSKHRATCGLPETYSTVGPNAWRDIETPKEILEKLCNAHNLPLPQYFERSVMIGSKVFSIPKTSMDKTDNRQRLALVALNNWKQMPIIGRPLVREHVETRNLFREDRPGLVRGKLSMWVDMFDMSLGSIPLPIDNRPRLPQAFELRVKILNTEKVPLVDETLLGEKACTDILVAGWLGDRKQIQKTDVHCKSYTGTGHFNWRFVFPFSYYRKEKKMVFYKKNLFDIGKTEEKVPPVLHLEVYDSEGLLEDSFIGGMVLDLCRMPRGSASLKGCKPEKIFDSSNFVDLFKVETLKGWWPFLLNKNIMKARGFLEAEFFLITAEEALKCPVGLGRAGPEPLPLPARAHSRKSPRQYIEHLINRYKCHSYFGISLNILIVLSLIALLGILVYTLPSTFDKLKPWIEQGF